MRPRVRSYGESARVTRSPASTRMRKRRILPAIVASTEWPLLHVTRKVELRSSSITCPSISIATSFAIWASPLGTGRGDDRSRERRPGHVARRRAIYDRRCATAEAGVGRRHDHRTVGKTMGHGRRIGDESAASVTMDFGHRLSSLQFLGGSLRVALRRSTYVR